MTRLLAPLLILLLTLTACPRPASDFIDDRAGLLNYEARWRLADLHQQLTARDLHLQLVILKESVADLAGEAQRQVEARQVGTPGRGARGVLLLVDPKAQRVRLVVGHDLAGLFTADLVERVEGEQMAPFFKSERIADGIEATVKLLVTQALQVGKTP